MSEYARPETPEEYDEMCGYAGDLEREIDALEAENAALKRECALRAEQITILERERRGWR